MTTWKQELKRPEYEPPQLDAVAWKWTLEPPQLPSYPLAVKEVHALVLAAADKLTPRAQELLRLRFVDDLNMAQVADECSKLSGALCRFCAGR